MPIRLLVGYLVITVLIYYFGPVKWNTPAPLKLALYLSANFGCLWLGYSMGIRRAENILRTREPVGVGRILVFPLLNALLLFSMIFTIGMMFVRLQAIRGDLGAVMATFLSPGQAYHDAQVMAQLDRDGQKTMMMMDYSWAFRVSTLLSVFSGLYFPIGLACWSSMSRGYKVLFVSATVATVFFTVGLGAQSWIGSLTFGALPYAIYRIYVGTRAITVGQAARMPRGDRSREANWRLRFGVVGSIVLLVGTVAFFQLDRAEAGGKQAELGDALVGQYGVHREAGIIPVTGGRLNFGIVMTCLYVSHGYQGLALSMELPFVWTYGIGWSKALQVILHQYLGGPDVFEQSYLMRNEMHSGWPALSWWSTIFPWIASDTTYPGTVLVMLLFGYFLGRTWGTLLLTGNPVGFALLAKLFTLVFMLPANNALAQSLDGFFGLVGIILIYLYSTRVVSRAPRGVVLSLGR